eukprot:ctg_411.g212
MLSRGNGRGHQRRRESRGDTNDSIGQGRQHRVAQHDGVDAGAPIYAQPPAHAYRCMRPVRGKPPGARNAPQPGTGHRPR